MTPRSFLCIASCIAVVPWISACSAEDIPKGRPIFEAAGSANANGGSAAGGTGGTSAMAGSASSGTSSGASANGGTGGSANGGAGATGNGGASAGSGGGGSASGGSGGGAGTAAAACPADKTFCSGFEDAALPAGAIYKVNGAPGEWTRDFEVDTTVFHGGKSSLKVKPSDAAGTSGSAYQMLAVPAPMAKFWARFYVRQADLDIGGLEHNVFAGASDSGEPNSSVMVEFAEDVGVSFNASDAVRWPMGFGRIEGMTKPFTLAKGMWHCIEISYDSETRTQKLYVNGTVQIEATNYPMAVATPFAFFKFGFNKLHGPARAVWYDDVAVGPTRPGCL